jgi:CO/xanthine dehydrogenase Mo-binding subunit
MRGDETGWDPKGPAMVHEMRGAVDAQGKIAAWDARIWSPTHSGRPDAKAGNTLPGILTGIPVPPPSFVGGDRDGVTNYTLPVQRVTIVNQQRAVIRQSAMRGLGGTQNSFANESFVDELAHAAGVDPIAFRRRHLSDPRELAVLDAVAPEYKPGRGVAFVHYENTEAIVAAVVDISVDRGTGAVRVNHVWIGHDCGLIVNPDGLRNQIEGNVIQATSRTLHEAVQLDGSRVASVDWASYPILRFSEVPEVTIRLIDRPNDKLVGAGEAATTVMAPAIANAIFAQTGKRLRRVPFTPDAVLSALKA